MCASSSHQNHSCVHRNLCVLYIFWQSRWIHNVWRSHVLATHSSVGRIRYRIATVHNFRLRNKWQTSERQHSFIWIQINCATLASILFICTFFAFVWFFVGTTGDGNVSAFIVVLQTPSKYRLFRISNIFAKHFDCDAVLGQFLDKPWGDECSCGIR